MRDFYRTYENYPSLLSRAMELGWIQNVVIMEADLTMELREWYMKAALQFGWSKFQLITVIADKIYEKIKISNDKCENIHISNHWRIRKTLYCATTGGRKYVRLICEMIYTKKVRRRCFGTRVA